MDKVITLPWKAPGREHRPRVASLPADLCNASISTDSSSTVKENGSKTKGSKKNGGPRSNAIILQTNKNNEDQAKIDREFQEAMADSSFLRNQLLVPPSLSRQHRSLSTPNLYIPVDGGPLSYSQGGNQYRGSRSPSPARRGLSSSPRVSPRMSPYSLSPAGSSSDLTYGVRIPVERMSRMAVGQDQTNSPRTCQSLSPGHTLGQLRPILSGRTWPEDNSDETELIADFTANQQFPEGNLFGPGAQRVGSFYPHQHGNLQSVPAYQNHQPYYTQESTSSIQTPTINFPDTTSDMTSQQQTYPVQYAQLQDTTYANVFEPRYESVDGQSLMGYQSAADHGFVFPEQGWNEIADFISAESYQITNPQSFETYMFPVLTGIQDQSNNASASSSRLINQQMTGSAQEYSGGLQSTPTPPTSSRNLYGFSMDGVLPEDSVQLNNFDDVFVRPSIVLNDDCGTHTGGSLGPRESAKINWAEITDLVNGCDVNPYLQDIS